MKTLSNIKTFMALCLLVFISAICTKTPPTIVEEEEEEEEEVCELLDIQLDKYLPSVNFKTRPGLYMENGILKHEGEAYAGIGVNFYGAFVNYFISDKKEFNGMFALLAERGIEYCRVNIGPFWPINYTKMNQNKQMYFDRLDEVVKAAEQNNIGLICCFFWVTSSISDFYDESCNLLKVPNSKTRIYMAQYAKLIVKRYMESPAIWGYEFGNEINLSVDLPNALDLLGPGNPALGQRPQYDENDIYTTEIVQPAMREFAQIVKKNDQYGRIVTSGNSEPRPSQYNQRTKKSWTTDKREQMAEAMAWHNPAPMDCVSVHIYDLLDRFLPKSENSYANLVKAYMEEAAAQNKALFVGEFFGLDGRCEEVIDAIVENRVPISAVWAVGGVEYSLSQDPARLDEVLNYIEEVNRKLKGQ